MEAVARVLSVIVLSFFAAHATVPTGGSSITCDDADVTDDGFVDSADVDLVNDAVWGPCPGGGQSCPADVDGSGIVDIDDLLGVFDFFGTDCANWPLVELSDPVAGTYVDSASQRVEYTLASGATVTEMRLNGDLIPTVASGQAITLVTEGPQTLRIDVAGPQASTGTASVEFTYETTNCPHRDLQPSPATCDFRLMLQGRYTDADLSAYGMSARAISLNGGWFHGFGSSITEEQFIEEAEDPAAMRARLVNLICSEERQLQVLAPQECDPASTEIPSDDIVLIDIESPEPLHRYTIYPDGSQLRTDMLLALKARIDVARSVMPNAKLVLWGHQPHPRGRIDTTIQQRLILFDQAGSLGVYDNLDYYMPLLYSHYGPNDFRRVTLNGNPYDVEVTYDKSLNGVPYSRLFTFFDAGENWQGVLAIWEDPLEPADTVTLEGDTFVALEGQGHELFSLESTTDGSTFPMDPSEEFFLEIVERYANQGLLVADTLSMSWPKPVAPLFSFNIFEQNTDHSGDPVPVVMAQKFIDVVQQDADVEMILYWNARWFPESEAFFRELEPVSRSCGCVVDECTDRLDNDGDVTTDDYDEQCRAGENCQHPTARLTSESIPNAPPDGTILEPVGDPSILVGDFVLFRGQGTDPEGEVHMSYLWDFGNQSGVADNEGLRPNRRYCAEGVHTATFTVTDSFWRSDPTPPTRTVTVGCRTPTAAVTLAVDRDESGDALLQITDPDGTCLATGYNVYRGNAASALSLLAQDAEDDDADAPEVQYTDLGSSAEPSLFYRVHSFNGICGSEGP